MKLSVPDSSVCVRNERWHYECFLYCDGDEKTYHFISRKSFDGYIQAKDYMCQYVKWVAGDRGDDENFVWRWE